MSFPSESFAKEDLNHQSWIFSLGNNGNELPNTMNQLPNSMDQHENAMATPRFDSLVFEPEGGVDHTMFAVPVDPFDISIFPTPIHPDMRFACLYQSTNETDRGLPVSYRQRFESRSITYRQVHEEPGPLDSIPGKSFSTALPVQAHRNLASTDIITDKDFPAVPSTRSGASRPEGVYKCQWEGCRYTGTFGRSTELKRHLETQHISPNAFSCPFVECSKSYNREDNLKSHLQRVHGWKA